jgi:gamma-glutamyltranspeptidase/glutathione hydrolase
MAGAQALHDRLGKLPFAELLQPAIWLAERGFAFGQRATEAVGNRPQVIRSPKARAIFAGPGGVFHGPDDVARQPELAQTLRAVAKHGAAYMYQGPWARRLIDTVRGHGGKMAEDDLRAYAPTWAEPLRITYGRYEVTSMPTLGVGGLATLGALKMVEAAGVRRLGAYAQSPAALFALIMASRWSLGWAGLTPQARRQYLPDVPDPSDGALLTDSQAAWAWEHARKGAVGAGAASASSHTAAVLTADRWGNVVSLVHSSNGDWFGTGMVVDGVFIPEPAAFQQAGIATAGPGARLPDQVNPIIALRGGRPFLASGAIGEGLHVASLQNLVNVLDLGMTPQQSGDQPKVQGPSYATDVKKEAVALGDFSPQVLAGLEALGQPLEVRARGWQQSTWVGLRVGDAPRYRSGVDHTSPGPAEGY